MQSVTLTGASLHKNNRLLLPLDFLLVCTHDFVCRQWWLLLISKQQLHMLIIEKGQCISMFAFINWSICRVSLCECDDRGTVYVCNAIATDTATDKDCCIDVGLWSVQKKEGHKEEVQSPHGCMAHGTALSRPSRSCFHLFRYYSCRLSPLHSQWTLSSSWLIFGFTASKVSLRVTSSGKK